MKLVSPAIVYRFYDSEDRLLYVGMTIRGVTRWADHSIDQAWWPEVASVRVAHFPDVGSALDAEANAIRTEEPVHNVIHRHRALAHGSSYEDSLDRRWMAGSFGPRRRR